MKRLSFLAMFFVLTIGLAGAVWGQGEPDDPCAGDCNEDLEVTVDETVLGISIGLGQTPLTGVCDNLDVNDDTVVTVDELVDSTISLLTRCGRNPLPTATPTFSPTPSPTPTGDVGGQYCGNGVTEENLGEECDDGGICVGGDNELGTCTATEDCPGGDCRPVGADGCAINCTQERLRKANLSNDARADVQQATFKIGIPLRGFQGFTTGKALDVTVRGPQNEVITRPGDYPVAIKPADVFFEPVSVTGLVCACVRQIEVPIFGPGNSAVGVIACGSQGIENIDYKLVQDHVTNPGSALNGNTPPVTGQQLPDDPECDDVFEFPGSGVTSAACLEGEDELCDDMDERGQHPGTCNSPRVIEFFGGNFPTGHALINNSTAIGLLNDGGQCRTDLSPGSQDCPADYGPDCQPCTDDDSDLGDPENLPSTTGTATAAVFDAAFQKGRTIDTVEELIPCQTTDECLTGQRCLRQCRDSGVACPRGDECGTGGDVCQEAGCSWNGCASGSFINRCINSKIGAPFVCSALANDTTPDDGDGDGLSGAALAVTFPSIDSRRIGDNVTSSLLDLE